jgi:hypothetical protein
MGGKLEAQPENAATKNFTHQHKECLLILAAVIFSRLLLTFICSFVCPILGRSNDPVKNIRSQGAAGHSMLPGGKQCLSSCRLLGECLQ